MLLGSPGDKRRAGEKPSVHENTEANNYSPIRSALRKKTVAVPQKPYALISLFDGASTALEALIQELGKPAAALLIENDETVSYTHLTLPTILRV